MEHNKLSRTPLPRIFLISSGEEDPDHNIRLAMQLSRLPRSISCMVQIREKQLDSRQLLALALEMRQVDLPEGTLLLVNERIDIALAASLDGVHLPESACSPDKLRPVAPKLIFGCSVHSQKSLSIAEESGADYLLFGPVFDTPSKRRYGAPQGVKKLGELCRTTKLPVFALGGITPDSASRCMEAGAYGIAALSIFQDPSRFVETIEQFHHIISP
ncbi:MAG: thiamine phosphate synthase [Chlorobium sp.]|nr:MAG: thiamine phosphate synthase [Chlorobium sp.]